MAVSVVISTDHAAADIFEHGGVLTATKRRVMHFEVDGQDVFTPRVTIPARPFLRSAFDATYQRALARIAMSIREGVEKVAKR